MCLHWEVVSSWGEVDLSCIQKCSLLSLAFNQINKLCLPKRKLSLVLIRFSLCSNFPWKITATRPLGVWLGNLCSNMEVDSLHLRCGLGRKSFKLGATWAARCRQYAYLCLWIFKLSSVCAQSVWQLMLKLLALVKGTNGKILLLLLYMHIKLAC